MQVNNGRMLFWHTGNFGQFGYNENLDAWCEAINALATSVTRFGDFLDFGQFFKAFGNNYFAQILHILRQFL